MVERFLCTTALEESWCDDRPVLFLGEWCRRYSRRERWSHIDAEVLPYHWDDRRKLHDDYQWLVELHERLLADLTSELNEIHGVDHGLRYWRILIGPWLGYFVQMLFDRWASIQQAVDQFDLGGGTIVLAGRDDEFVPNDMSDFGRLFLGDPWNHAILADILRQYTNVPWRTRERVQPEHSQSSEVSVPQKRGLLPALTRLFEAATRMMVRDDDAFFLSTYLPMLDEFRMQWRLGQVPQRWRVATAARTAVDLNRRRAAIVGDNRTKFESCARQFILRQIPVVYLEGYKELVEHADDLGWPKRPKVIWTSSAHLSDDLFKAWAADKTEKASSLVIGQHGGHYGTGLWCFVEDHDTKISDRYLSWGWSEPNKPVVQAVGQLKAKRPLGVRHSDLDRALLVTCSLPRYSYWMYSSAVAGQWLDYFADQCAFVENLPDHLKEALIVRLYPLDFGWDQFERWSDRFPGLSIDRGETRIDTLIRRSRLYISTYNATTFLESLAMNVPTVIYWNEKHWELRDSAQARFDELKEVGVFHSTPESAAHHVAQIWNDVDAWWSGPALQAVVARFKSTYCDLPDDLLGRVEQALRGAIQSTSATAHR